MVGQLAIHSFQRCNRHQELPVRVLQPFQDLVGKVGRQGAGITAQLLQHPLVVALGGEGAAQHLDRDRPAPGATVDLFGYRGRQLAREYLPDLGQGELQGRGIKTLYLPVDLQSAEVQGAVITGGDAKMQVLGRVAQQWLHDCFNTRRQKLLEVIDNQQDAPGAGLDAALDQVEYLAGRELAVECIAVLIGGLEDAGAGQAEGEIGQQLQVVVVVFVQRQPAAGCRVIRQLAQPVCEQRAFAVPGGGADNGRPLRQPLVQAQFETPAGEHIHPLAGRIHLGEREPRREGRGRAGRVFWGMFLHSTDCIRLAP